MMLTVSSWHDVTVKVVHGTHPNIEEVWVGRIVARQARVGLTVTCDSRTLSNLSGRVVVAVATLAVLRLLGH